MVSYLFLTGITLLMLQSCQNSSAEENVNNDKKMPEKIIRESDFLSVPGYAKPWVYYWWLKGNVSKELITRDLEEMQKKGIGGFLLFDSRGYHDGYYDGNIPVPLNIKLKFMSPEWREMVKHTMNEANRLGLEMSINLANTGGSLRGPWDLGQDGPKKLIWTSKTVSGPAKISELLKTPGNTRYYKDVALMAVKERPDQQYAGADLRGDLNGEWNEVAEPGKNPAVAEKSVDLSNKIKEGLLQWEVPEGNWKILRFGSTVIADTGSVDILNKEAVTRYFYLMGNELLKDAGPLAGKTLKYFYNVSWEGGEPNWTQGFEHEFLKFRGYEINDYMPVLTGMIVNNPSVSERFMRDYFRTVTDCFRENCYETMGQLCNTGKVDWHSEDGGPWVRTAAMFKEADMLSFWGTNDIPQGEFWVPDVKGLSSKSNSRYASMAAHIYGKTLSAVEAFTNMAVHYSEYPAMLKPYADRNFIDGSNMFIWHTFTASPPELGKPGFEYFAGTHLNPNVTWWNMAGSFITYLGRCQYMLRQGDFVADVCSYVSDKNYVTWGRGEKWNIHSDLKLNPGYRYDLLNTDVLVNRLSVEDGSLVLPGGMKYRLLVVDMEDKTIPLEALKKIIELAKKGATIVLGKNKPEQISGIKDYPECDREVVKIANQLWREESEKPMLHRIGKGMIFTGTSIEDVLKQVSIVPDFEGPFEYIHRKNGQSDIYFISGTGKAECVFRVKGKKPEIWNPASGETADAISYRFKDDGRTMVPVDLPENGSVFVVFRNQPDKSHITSVEGPVAGLELTGKEGDATKVSIWKTGAYDFSISDGRRIKKSIETGLPIELSGTWNVTFKPAEGGVPMETSFEKLSLWNENSEPSIKYFSGTAIYRKSFSVTGGQANCPARLQLGKVFNISRVWVNGKDLGIIWTAPWVVDLTGILRQGTNDLKIEVTNCWVNRLIGDTGLPPEKRRTNTNIRLVQDRKDYRSPWQAISAQDPLLPSGLPGPVRIEFGKAERVSL